MQRFPLSADRIGEILQAPLGFAIGMIAGTAWYFSIPFEPDARVVWSLALAVFGGGWLGLKGVAPRGAIYVWIVVCGLVFGVASGSAATLRAHHNMVPTAIGPILVEGWVTDAQPSRTGVRLILDIHAIDGLDPVETPETVRLTHILSLKTEPGRFVRCWAVLRPPPQPVIAGDYDFARQAWFSGLGAVGYVQGRCRGGTLGAPRTWVRQMDLDISKWRRRLAQHVRAAAGDRAGGFAAALASGDRSFMPQSDQEALRASGLAHLLAISGLHMGIVGGLVFLFVWRGLALVEPIALRVAVKKPAALTALIACAVYLIISGASVSTQRAFIMSAVLFGAILLDRTALSLRSLAIAMIAILILAPWSVLTPGFQMSFAATGALIATYEGWQKHQRKRGLIQRNGISFWLKSLVVTSTVS
ncbi:MAG: ComEC/Rec2 family competence protein, partial [Pseudomonadota bacterium]